LNYIEFVCHIAGSIINYRLQPCGLRHRGGSWLQTRISCERAAPTYSLKPQFCLYVITSFRRWRHVVPPKLITYIAERLCNRYCGGEAISITYSEFMFVALGIQHAMRTRHILMCDLPVCIIFSHIIS
jgi:hypothetical protein